MAQTLQNKYSPSKTMESQRQFKKPLTLLSTLDEDNMNESINNPRKKLQLPLPQQQRWFKKGMTSPLLTPESNRDDDPFAGMTTGVNYQQEIERIKSIVPKVDPSKKTNHRRPKSVGAYNNNNSTNNYFNTINVTASGMKNNTVGRTRSMGLPSPTFSRQPSPPSPSSSTNNNNNNNNNNNIGSRLSITSTESSPSSSPYYYDANSHITSPSLSTPRSLSPVQSDYALTTIPPVPEEDEQQCVIMADEEEQEQANNHNEYDQQRSVITEEEKTRFLQFVRNWTGGWKQWERNDNNCNSNSSNYYNSNNNDNDDDDNDVGGRCLDGHYSGMEFVRGGGSLWSEQLPWTKHIGHQRRCSWQEARSNRHYQQHHRPLTVALPDRKFVISMRSEPCTPLLTPR